MNYLLEKFNNNILPHNSSIAVALSGGKDSVALLYSLIAVKEQFNLDVKAINIDHNLRDTSRRDSNFVRTLCDKLSVPLMFFDVDVNYHCNANKLSLEVGARQLRYNAFNEAISSGFCQYIALGHHMNDSVETTLMNLFKGSGLKGMSGLSSVRDVFIRPMLSVTRKEIDEFMTANSLLNVEDESNADSDYQRNYIRNEIIPIIADKFDGAVNNIYNFSKLARRDDEFLLKMATELVHIDGENVSIDIADFKHNSLYTRAIFIALATLGVHCDIYERNIIDIENLALHGENGSQVQLSGGVCCYRDYSKISFVRCSNTNGDMNNSSHDIELPVEIGNFNLDFGKLHINFVDKFQKMPKITCIDFDKLPSRAIIRTRKTGDVFARKGGTKSLKDYFIDKKIPSRLRDNYLVIAEGSTVHAVVGVECGKLLLVSNDTKNIVSLYITND